MSTVQVHQFVPSLAMRDAIGQHTFAMQAMLRSVGIDSEIFADEMKPGTEELAKHYHYFHPRPSKNRLLIYQASTLSPMAAFLSERPEPKVLNYHNVTPPQTISQWEFGASMATSIALDQIGKLSHQVVGAIAVSNFNAADLKALGYDRPVVAAPFITHGSVEPRPDQDRPVGARWLFVGRIFPNKAQHDLVAALAAYRRIYDPAATLTLVGGRSSDRYALAIEEYAKRLGISDAVSMTGSIPDDGLEDLYRTSDLFVCASDHEGFCFPIVEAMRARLPVVAYGSSAIPETVGKAGFIVYDKSPINFATAAWITLTDSGLRNAFYSQSEIQLAKYSQQEARKQNLNALSKFIKLPVGVA